MKEVPGIGEEIGSLARLVNYDDGAAGLHRVACSDDSVRAALHDDGDDRNIEAL